MLARWKHYARRMRYLVHFRQCGLRVGVPVHRVRPALRADLKPVNRKTGYRIKYMKVDSDTGEEVPNEDIVKGYKVDTDTFIEVTKDELEEVALETTRTIEIDEFVGA